MQRQLKAIAPLGPEPNPPPLPRAQHAVTVQASSPIEAGAYVKIALISDIHGNLAALKAVLADAAQFKVDRVACLGDCATLGPKPCEVLAVLREVASPLILGNHDEFLLDPSLLQTYTHAPVIVASVAWCRRQLHDTDLTWLASMVRQETISLGDQGNLLLFHGSPTSPMQDILASHTDAEVDALIGEADATLIACGHTHLQMVRQHRGRLIVNPGSVGMPFVAYVQGREPELMAHAEYGIVQADSGGVSVTLRRVPVDPRLALADLMDSDLPLAPTLRHHYSSLL